MQLTKEQHLDWVRQRALAYCDRNECKKALDSLTSDLLKHPETVGIVDSTAFMQLAIALRIRQNPALISSFIDSLKKNDGG